MIWLYELVLLVTVAVERREKNGGKKDIPFQTRKYSNALCMHERIGRDRFRECL